MSDKFNDDLIHIRNGIYSNFNVFGVLRKNSNELMLCWYLFLKGIYCSQEKYFTLFEFT